MNPLKLRGVRGASLSGEVRPPGDEAISHLALALGAMADGTTRVEGLSQGADVHATWGCLRELGVNIVSRRSLTTVKGRGWRGLETARRTLEAGSSAFAARLVLAVAAGNPVVATLDADGAAGPVPVESAAAPLRAMGAIIDLWVPGDLSLAGPWLVAAAALPGSAVRLLGVGANPTRTGLLAALGRMGAAVEIEPVLLGGAAGPEPAADVSVRHAPLVSTEADAACAPGLGDDAALFAVAATQAAGISLLRGLGGWDRPEDIGRLLTAFGAKAAWEGGILAVEGPCGLKAARFDAAGDARLARAAFAAALLAEGESELAGAACLEGSYPSLLDDLRRLQGGGA